MIDVIEYFVFVIVPVFLMGFQAVLLAVLFFLKARQWLSPAAFCAAGATAGAGYGYVFAGFSSPESILTACLAVAAFGVASGAMWWYLLVKREGARHGRS